MTRKVSKHFIIYKRRDHYWHLVHAPSGYSMGVAYKYIKRAKDTAKLLEGVEGIDWADDSEFVFVNAPRKVQKQIGNIIRKSVGLHEL